MENKLAVIKKELDSPSIKQRIEERLQKNAGAFTTSLVDLCANNEYLQNCPPKAIIREALKAATLNLTINNNMGYAYIIPFKNEPQFIIGYKGYIQLCLRSGKFRHLNSAIIYDGEYIKEDKIKGTFTLSGRPANKKVIGYTSYFELLNGFEKGVYWTKEEVIEHATKYSKSFNSKVSPWKTDFDAMAKKTMILRLKPYFPMEIEVQNIIPEDSDYQDDPIEEVYDAENAELVDIPEEDEIFDPQPHEIFDGTKK